MEKGLCGASVTGSIQSLEDVEDSVLKCQLTLQPWTLLFLSPGVLEVHEPPSKLLQDLEQGKVPDS